MGAARAMRRSQASPTASYGPTWRTKATRWGRIVRMATLMERLLRLGEKRIT